MTNRHDPKSPVPHPFDAFCRKGGNPQTLTACFVTGQDFSRAATPAKTLPALAPGGRAPSPFIRCSHVLIYTLALTTLLLLSTCAPPDANHPVIGAKNFTEQVVLGELL